MALLGGIGGFLEDTFKAVTGQAAEDEAKRAGGRAKRAGEEAIELSQQALEDLRTGLDPYAQALGTDLLPQVSNLFGETAGESILSDPVLQSLLGESQRRIEARQAATGRPEGETQQFLQDAALRTGYDFLRGQRQDLLGALQFGQQAETQRGLAGIGTASTVGDLLTQIANAQSAAGIAGKQARSGAIGNIAGGIGQIVGLGGLGNIFKGFF